MIKLATFAGYILMILALLTSIMSTAFSLALQMMALGILIVAGAYIARASKNGDREQ